MDEKIDKEIEKAICIVFSGRILTKCKLPIKNAHVSVSGFGSTTTNCKGYFRLLIEIDNIRTNRFVLNIKKKGYADLSKVYNTGIRRGIWFLTRATRTIINPTIDNIIVDTRPRFRTCSGTLRSQVNWSRFQKFYGFKDNPALRLSDELKKAVAISEQAKTCNDGIRVAIPANSLVDDSGNLPTGSVSVTVSTVDIYDPDSMPGDYTVDMGKGRTGFMVTYGAGSVTAIANGKNYQPKKKDATIFIPMNSFQLKNLGKKGSRQDAELLKFNEETGMWERIGSTEYLPKSQTFQANLNQFSTFNVDLVRDDPACIKVDATGLFNEDTLHLEITTSYDEIESIVKRKSADNSSLRYHAIINLPQTKQVGVQAYRPNGTSSDPITEVVYTNSGGSGSNPLPNYDDCIGDPADEADNEVVLAYDLTVPTIEYQYLENDGIKLTFRFNWQQERSGLRTDLFELWESADGGSYSKIDNTKVRATDSTEYQDVEYHLKRNNGVYKYKLRAMYGDYPTEYSDETSPFEITLATKLTIQNHLSADNNGSGFNWYEINGVLLLRIGRTKNIACDHSDEDAIELLNPDYEFTTDRVYQELRPPRIKPHPNYGDPNHVVQPIVPGEDVIPAIVRDTDGSYWMYIKCGNWGIRDFDSNINANFWPAFYDLIYDCDGATRVKKEAVVKIEPQYKTDTDVIDLSTIIPMKHFKDDPEDTDFCDNRGICT